MKTEDVFEAIAKDLDIDRYEGEALVHFRARVVYSAVGNWVRMLCLADTSTKQYLSKSALHRKINMVIGSFIKVEPKLYPWFYSDSEFNSENAIRHTLLMADVIREYSFETKIVTSESTVITMSETMGLVKGYQDSNRISFVSGLANFTNGEYGPNEINKTSIVSPEECIKEEIDKAVWEPLSKIDNFEIFNPNIDKVFSSCWEKYMTIIPNQIYVARSEYTYKAFNYCFIKLVNDQYMISRFSEYSQNEYIRNTQRLLYACKAIYGKKARINVEIGKQYSIWHFWSNLPPFEDNLMRYIGWPLEDIKNGKSEFVVRNEVSFLVEEIVKSLGLVVERKSL